jgi:hypothetical protein
MIDLDLYRSVEIYLERWREGVECWYARWAQYLLDANAIVLGNIDYYRHLETHYVGDEEGKSGCVEKPMQVWGALQDRSIGST